MRWIITYTFIGLCLYSSAQITDDLQLDSSWYTGIGNSGTYYGRILNSQVPDHFEFAGLVTNLGANIQNGVSLSNNLGLINTVISAPQLNPSSSILFSDVDSNYAYSVGVHSGEVYCYSNEDNVGGAEYGNNTKSYEFEIVQDGSGVYSVDGVGLYSNLDTSEFGTQSGLLGGEDGLQLITKYHIRNSPGYICAARALLGPSTQDGGEIFIHVVDSADFVNPQLGWGFLYSSSSVISSSDVNNGYVEVYYNQYLSLPSGTYYLVAELYSNANTSPTSIIVDNTVPQPQSVSGYKIAGDTTIYWGENAFAIQFSTYGECGWGLSEIINNDIEITPNPATNQIQVFSSESDINNIIIVDVYGNSCLSGVYGKNSFIDLTSFSSGLYFVQIKNDLGSVIKRLLVNN